MNVTPSNPLVTVILPVYNGAEFVGVALESVLKQTYTNLEVIAVNDGSTDGTQAVLESYAAKDARVRVVQQVNGGVARARNHAIELARGEFIAPIDADDLWLPQKIERQVGRMLRGGEKVGFVYCAWVWIDTEGRVLDRAPRWNVDGNALEPLIFINFTGNASVPLFRKHCLVEIGGYNESLAREKAGGCEDWEVVLRIAARYRIAVVGEVLLGYRRSPGSMSSACETMLRSQQKVMARLREEMPELPDAIFQASDRQFAMYLAGVSYWSGNLVGAIRWALRAGIGLSLKVAPFALGMILFGRGRWKRAQVLRPGRRLDAGRIPKPLLPYDIICDLPTLLDHLFFGWLTRLGPISVRARLSLEAAWARRRSGPRRPRVMAMGTPQFPVYSHTFVYRELEQMRKGGFDVRLAYLTLGDRKDLADDAAELWGRRQRIPVRKVIGMEDVEWCRREFCSKFVALVERLASASGFAEGEIFAHRDFRLACAFTRLAAAWKAEYVHTYFFYEQALCGLVASALLDIPRGVTCYADHMVQDYALKVLPLQMATCDVVVATSERIRTELDQIAGQALPQVMVKPNGIDSSRYSTGGRPRRDPAQAVEIVAVNRIHGKKGVEYLLQAALLLRERGLPFVVRVLGEAEQTEGSSLQYAERMRRFVEEHGLGEQVQFLGRQTTAQVRERLMAADLFVAPFVELDNGDKDGVPTALLEAMAAGCAAIVTDAGSIPEVVTGDVNGIMIPQRDAEALARAIERLAANEDLRRRLADAGRERVREHFDVARREAALHERIRAAIAARDPFAGMVSEPTAPGALNIALLSYEYPPETGFGGIGTYTWYQARALARLGHRVHVLAGSTDRMSRMFSRTESEGVTVFRTSPEGSLRLLGRVLRVLRCFWTATRLENAAGMGAAFEALEKQFRYDIAEAPECGAEGARIAQRGKTPVVVRLHGPAKLVMEYYGLPWVDRMLCATIESAGMQAARAVNSCSRFLAGEAKTKLGIRGDVETIYNGIDLDLFDVEPPADLNALYDCPKGKLTVLFAGRMEKRKGIEIIEEVVTRVLEKQDVLFLFAGEDPNSYLQDQVLSGLADKGLAGSVRYLGKLGLKELRSVAKAVDIYLLPSLWENCPYACIEAMAASRPVVASRQGGMPEIIEHGVNGMLGELGSAASFAEHVMTLIGDKALRERMGAAARRTVEERFRDDVIAGETVAYYRRVLKR